MFFQSRSREPRMRERKQHRVLGLGWGDGGQAVVSTFLTCVFKWSTRQVGRSHGSEGPHAQCLDATAGSTRPICAETYFVELLLRTETMTLSHQPRPPEVQTTRAVSHLTSMTSSRYQQPPGVEGRPQRVSKQRGWDVRRKKAWGVQPPLDPAWLSSVSSGPGPPSQAGRTVSFKALLTQAGPRVQRACLS